MLGGPGKFDKNGAVWCILSVPKLVIINLKINIFLIINQQSKFCAIFFSKINPDGHFGTKKYIHILQEGSRGGGGVIALRSQRYEKKGGFTFLQQISHTGCKDISCNDVDSNSC